MNQRKSTTCGFDGCLSYVWSRGYCAAHYTKLKKAGQLKPVRPRGTAIERFNQHYTVNTVTGCWEWNCSLNRGYAIHCDDQGKIVRAARFAYTSFVGEIPEGLDILHSCDNPKCVNWESHLSPGTKLQNMRDCSLRGRTAGQRGKVKRKITVQMATNIRVCYARGISIKRLAEIYNSSATTVNNIVKGKIHLRVVA